VGHEPCPHPDLSERDGPDEILHQLSRATGPLTIVSLGPLTNLALAADRDPELFGRVERLVMMGGAFFGPGNITPAAEFNIFADPDAARMVFSSGIPITAVGLDVTRQVRLDRPTVEKLVQDRRSEVSRSIQAWTARLLDRMAELEGEASMPLHDPLAVLVCLQPGLVRTEAMHVEVETGGRAATGLTLADLRPIRQVWKDTPNLEVCTEVKSRSALEMFLEGLP
jgi:inosine-uridine nucleoside N-ribohydrolase